MRTFSTALVAAGLLAASGCAGGGGEIRLGPGRSFDGLVEVKDRRVSAAWVRPDFDLSGYTKVMLEGAGIEYRPPERMAGRSAGRRQFPLSETKKRQVEEIMESAFRSELARSSRFELTDAAGPDVLLVWGGLLDVVSFVPPLTAGREDVFLRRLGEATLVIELRDSQSRATLARMMDRRALEHATGGFHANSVNGLGELRQLASSWARLVRRRIDTFPALQAAQP